MRTRLGVNKVTIDLFYDVRFGADISRKAWSAEMWSLNWTRLFRRGFRIFACRFVCVVVRLQKWSSGGVSIGHEGSRGVLMKVLVVGGTGLLGEAIVDMILGRRPKKPVIFPGHLVVRHSTR
jgi:hypothetical protein